MTISAKTRLLRALTVLLCMLLGVASFAAGLQEPAHAAKCHGMTMPVVTHHGAGHDCCPRKVEITACCPMHMGAMPMQCAPQPECCQISEERTLPLPRESSLSSNNLRVHTRSASILLSSTVAQSNLQSEWLQLGLRYSRPVFEAKADLRI